jgi:hypothetical protein
MECAIGRERECVINIIENVCKLQIITAAIMISIMMIILQLNEMKIFGIYVLRAKLILRVHVCAV